MTSPPTDHFDRRYNAIDDAVTLANMDFNLNATISSGKAYIYMQDPAGETSILLMVVDVVE